MTKPELKAVLFDMDDTLIDWSGWDGDWSTLERLHMTGVYRYLTQELGRDVTFDVDALCDVYGAHVTRAWDDARTTMRAPHIGQIILETLADFGIKEDDDITLTNCLLASDWAVLPGVSVFPDVPDALKQFTERGITIGIVTNASQPMILRDRELEGYGLLDFFPQETHRIAAADVGYLKPHPQIFHHALDVVGAQPHEAVYVGDNLSADIGGARQVGMKAVLRVNGHRSRGDQLIRPDATVKSLHEIFDHLPNWFAGY